MRYEILGAKDEVRRTRYEVRMTTCDLWSARGGTREKYDLRGLP